MSHFEYEESKIISGQDYSFYALIMAAMRKADSSNQIALAFGFPGVWKELQERYNAPGGVLPLDDKPGHYAVTVGEETSFDSESVHDSLPSYACPVCKMVSFNHNDIVNRYCGQCHKFEADR